MFGSGDVSFELVNFGKDEAIFDKVDFGSGNVSFRGAMANIISLKECHFNNYLDMRVASAIRAIFRMQWYVTSSTSFPFASL